MKRNTIILSLVIFLAIILGLYILFSGSKISTSSIDYQKSNIREFKESRSTKSSTGNFGNTMESSFFDSLNLLNYNEFTEALKFGKINFVWELWALRDKCPENSTIVQCNQMILEMIDKKFNPPENEQIKKLFKQYFEYESEIVKMDAKDLDFSKKYEELKKKRREHFSEEEAQLIFGMEEAQVNFMDKSAEFFEKTKNLSGNERVKQYEALKKKVYGNFYDSVVSREDKFDHYQTELNLREKDLSSLNEEQRQKEIRKLQEKYFGKEGADRIAQVQKEEEEYQKKLKEYEKKEANFLKENSNLKKEELEKKLKEFRVQNLGEEEAEMYTRRKALENF